MSRSRPADPTRGLVTLPGGSFVMGTEDADANPDDAETVREESVAPFRLAATATTTSQFASFVKATGHVTTAEREGWSAVFYALADPAIRARCTPNPSIPWWVQTPGASWRNPTGTAEPFSAVANHPVVHVSHDDAAAYASWAGLRLPTEVEWEYAARGGLEQARYPWGDELTPHGRWLCNIWQGDFPRSNTEDDGFVGTAPVRSFPPNGYQLYEMTGNVWEWTASTWATPAPEGSCCAPAAQPTGASLPESMVIRGGSYLCHDSYCNRYRVSARTHTTADSTAGNHGFRVAADA